MTVRNCSADSPSESRATLSVSAVGTPQAVVEGNQSQAATTRVTATDAAVEAAVGNRRRRARTLEAEVTVKRARTRRRKSSVSNTRRNWRAAAR